MRKTLYTYYPEFNGNDELLWLVYEEATAQIVGEFFFEEDAEKMCKDFENGKGFNGFTPAFMLRKVPKDINEAFSMEFSE